MIPQKGLTATKMMLLLDYCLTNRNGQISYHIGRNSACEDLHEPSSHLTACLQ